MTYLLDTNVVSELMRSPARIESWMAGLGPGDHVVTCTIVRGEVLFGIAKLPKSTRRSELEEASHRCFAAIPCEPIPERAGDLYADLKLARQQRGLTLDENDLWVAATALALRATLVSRDRDFRGIDGLSIVALD